MKAYLPRKGIEQQQSPFNNGQYTANDKNDVYRYPAVEEKQHANDNTNYGYSVLANGLKGCASFDPALYVIVYY